MRLGLVRCFCLLGFLTLFMAGCASVGETPEKRVGPPPSSAISPRFISLTARPGDSFESLALRHLDDPSLGWLLAEVNGTESAIPGQSVIIPLDPLEVGGITLKGYQTVPILTYHKFTKGRADITTVNEKVFEEQMKFLKTNGYRVITLDAFYDFLDFRRQIPPKSVVITADDGWRSFYDIAFPILKKYGYPATLFVYTDFISANGKSLLNWGVLREMANNGISIQSHTKTHRYLDRRLSTENYREYFEAIKKEVTESARVIKKNLDVEVKYLAYPYGETNHLVAALLEKLQYRGGFTVDRAGSPSFSNRFRINRSMIYGTFDLQDFENNLKVFTTQAARQ